MNGEGRMSKKPRKKSMDPRKAESSLKASPCKDKDWGFDEIARSKMRRR